MAKKKAKAKKYERSGDYSVRLGRAARSVRASWNFNHPKPSASYLVERFGITLEDANKLLVQYWPGRDTNPKGRKTVEGPRYKEVTMPTWSFGAPATPEQQERVKRLNELWGWLGPKVPTKP